MLNSVYPVNLLEVKYLLRKNYVFLTREGKYFGLLLSVSAARNVNFKMGTKLFGYSIDNVILDTDSILDIRSLFNSHIYYW